MAMYPIYLPRRARESAPADEYDAEVSQNEVNLNQNLEILSAKLAEIESYLAASSEQEETV